MGANVENVRVHLGLHGGLYDVTAFCRDHPGSPETLLDFAGADVTATFEDVGHSTTARSLAASMLLVQAPRTGALASVRDSLTKAKRAVARTAPSVCPACANDVNGGRPFFDATTATWRCWWPCCGAVRPGRLVPEHAPWSLASLA